MKSILTFIVSLILGPFVVGVGIELARPHLPEALPVALGWFAMLTEWAGFPWVLSGGIGLLVGLWLDRIAGTFDGRYPLTKSGKLKRLAPIVESIANRCDTAIQPMSIIYVDLNALMVEIIMVGRKLSALGIAEPYIPKDHTSEYAMANTSVMFSSLLPALEQGDIATAREVAQWVRDNQISSAKT